MTTLVIGANGLVGSNVLDQLIDQESRVVGTYHSESPAIDVESRQLDIGQIAVDGERFAGSNNDELREGAVDLRTQRHLMLVPIDDLGRLHGANQYPLPDA